MLLWCSPAGASSKDAVFDPYGSWESEAAPFTMPRSRHVADSLSPADCLGSGWIIFSDDWSGKSPIIDMRAVLEGDNSSQLLMGIETSDRMIKSKEVLMASKHFAAPIKRLVEQWREGLCV